MTGYSWVSRGYNAMTDGVKIMRCKLDSNEILLYNWPPCSLNWNLIKPTNSNAPMQWSWQQWTRDCDFHSPWGYIIITIIFHHYYLPKGRKKWDPIPEILIDTSHSGYAFTAELRCAISKGSPEMLESQTIAMV